MIVSSKFVEETKKSVTIKLIDGFYWVMVHKDGKLVYENRHLYEDTAMMEADQLFYKGKLYNE